MDAFTSAADRIARGDFSHRITEKVISEYEAIISQMNLMMGQLEGAQTEKVAAEKQINLVVDALGSSLSSLAEGNLESALDIEVAPEFAKLKSDFNSAVTHLKSTIALVKKGAGSIKLGTEEISQASDDLSRRTENQAASLEETAAAVEGDHRYGQQDGARRDARPRNGVGRQGRRREGRRGRPQGHRSHERHREFVEADQPDHRRHRRDRVPDQPAGVECRRRSGARRRCRPRLRGRRVRSARSGAALGRSGEGDQGSDFGFDRAGCTRRAARRRNRQGADAHRHAGRRNQHAS